MGPARPLMVNALLTFFIKVNVPPAAESQFLDGGNPMKKRTQTRWSFWDWLLGGGGGGGGSSG